MKFFLTRGSQVREKFGGFPPYYSAFFRFSKILVVCMLNDNIVAGACGITSLSNYGPVSFVKEEYRRKAIGPQLIEKTIRAARNQGLSFILASAPAYNVPMVWSLHVKFGFRVIIVLEKSSYVILMLPLTYRGELLYAILRVICLKLPNSLVGYTIDFFAYVFDWIRVKIIGRM